MSRASIFQSVKGNKVPRSTFDMSHDVKFSMRQGVLTPVMFTEVVPGDHWTGSVDSLIRYAPMLAPVMQQANSFIHYWFVPYRILWDNWQNFITSTHDADTPAHPYLNLEADDVGPGTLFDYLSGSVAKNDGSITGANNVSAFPFAAYQCIYNEKYRDQNLITPVPYKLVDGNNSGHLDDFTTLRKRAWEHDYFTACLPFAQKGDSVDIPVGEFLDVPVVVAPGFPPSAAQPVWRYMADGQPHPIDLDPPRNSNNSNGANNPPNPAFPADSIAPYEPDVPPGAHGVNHPSFYDPNGTLIAQTSALQAEAATINNLRLAVQLQKFFEAAARGGTRYYEWVESMFGVRPSDARFQQPEYLGGSMSGVVISEVLQSSQTADTPQGNMAGHGYSVGSGKQFKFYAEEYGCIVAVMSVLPKTAYQQGLPKAFRRLSPTDYYNPFFANLGEQEVKNSELYFTNNPATDDLTFGYIPRFAEYKYAPCRVAGQFKTTLNFWHQGRIFDAQPALNGNFVSSDPTKRIFADEDEQDDELWCQVFHQLSASRPMPFFGTPAGL